VLYTLDGGKTNYTDMCFSGSIDQEAWEAVDSGLVKIRFYVDDKPGHTAFQEVTVFKEDIIGFGDGADDDEVYHYFTLASPLGVAVLGAICVPVGLLLKHEIKREPKEEGSWITKEGKRIFLKGVKKLKRKK
jgi:hypothetical protein